MKKLILAMAITSTVSSFGQNPISYPQTKKGDVMDVYFDTKVNDYLETLQSEQPDLVTFDLTILKRSKN